MIELTNWRTPTRRRKIHCRHVSRLRFEALEPRNLLAVDVFAAGATGEETLALQVDGQTVQTWDNIGGDYVSGSFQQFTYDVDGISADRLRVAFTNDGVSTGGEDKNLRVDRIVVDGVTYQSEAVDVLSTGTWTADNDCGPGFKQSEFLHCDGHFDFANAAVNSVIRVLAAGATGEETIELRIDGVPVDTFSDIGGDYDARQFITFTHQASSVVSPSQVEIAFVNNGISSTGEDKNVRIDGVEIDGQFYEAEAPNVRSTGTWSTDDGCAEGFKESEQLHCSGSLFFDQGSVIIEVFAAGATGEESLELVVDGVVVAAFANIAGNYDSGEFETFTYNAPASVAADQVRVAFINNGTSSSGEDKNVRIDAIAIDGVRYESEDATVFSIGSWSTVDGCGAGFKASEFLHCDGYLQYASAPPVNPGVVALATNSYSVGETDAAVNVVIERDQGTDGIITIDYRTISNTALAGEDFESVAGRAIFFAGDSSKVITIPILDDALEESTESFSFTIDNIQGGATLLAPRTAQIEILDDENPPGGGSGVSVTFADFNDTTGLQFNGDATVVAGQLLLADDAPSQVGSVFFDQAILFHEDASFTSAMEIQIDAGEGSAGADGLAFILQNTVAESQALGGVGGGIGYHGIGPASFAIELDTYQNESDTDDNHISLLTSGDVESPFVSIPAPLDLNGGAVIHLWVQYDGPSDLLEVFVSDTPTQPSTATLTASIDLAAVLGSQAFWGLSAATGGLTNEHKVLSWTIESTTEFAPPPVIFTNEPVVEGLTLPIAIEWSSNGQNMYIAEKSGIVRVFRGGQLYPTPVVDFSDQVNDTHDRGLLDIAVHPDLDNHPYLYLLYTYDPPEVFDHTGLAGPDGVGNRAGRLSRFTLDATTEFTTVIPASDVVLLGSNSTWDNFNAFVDSTSDFSEPPAGILPGGGNLQDFLAADSSSHSVGQVEFGADGALYVTNGDGTSFNQVDPRSVRVQDVDNLSGKLLRVDPLTGAGLPDNPFFTGDPQRNQSKVYQYGFRNPFRFTLDPADGQVYVGDVGWTQWEEVNAGQPGDNFGWPYYEGGNGTSLQTIGYEDLPEAQAFYASGQPVTSAILALNHATEGINAIVMGDIYDGTVYPAEFQGDLLFNDLGQGIVRNISFDADGGVASVDVFADGANIVVQIRNGPDGHMYYVDLDDGIVGRWVQLQPPQAAGSGQGIVAQKSIPSALTGSDGGPADEITDSLPIVIVGQDAERANMPVFEGEKSRADASDQAERTNLNNVLSRPQWRRTRFRPEPAQWTSRMHFTANQGEAEVDEVFAQLGQRSRVFPGWKVHSLPAGLR